MVAVGRYQHEHPQRHQFRQQPGQKNLVARVQMALRTVDDEQVVGGRLVADVEVEIGKSPGRGRRLAQRDVVAAVLATRPGDEPDVVPGAQVVAADHVPELSEQLGGLPESGGLAAQLREVSREIDVVVDRVVVAVGHARHEQDRRERWTDLVVPQLLQDFDHLAHLEVELAMEQRDPDAVRGEHEGTGQQFVQQKAVVRPRGATLDLFHRFRWALFLERDHQPGPVVGHRHRRSEPLGPVRSRRSDGLGIVELQ